MNTREQANPSEPAPIRLALVGAGIYATDAHVPSLLRLQDRFRVVAVYSRTQEAAAALAEALPGPVAIFTDLDALIAFEEIDAFDVMLPIVVMPSVVTRLLATGKHVVSEKPIAPTVAEAKRLMAGHQPAGSQVWMVAENWRYEAAFQQAGQWLRDGEIGVPVTCHWAINMSLTPSSKYFHSTWRRAGDFPGGSLLDAGVHHIAALRLVVGEIAEVSAVVTQVDQTLPPADTLSATLRFENGALGAYIASYAAGAFWPQQLHVAGTAGSLRVQRREIELLREGKTERVETGGYNGVEVELAAFADAIRSGAAHLNTAQNALQDLAVIEAMLRSADLGQAVRPADLL